MELKPDGGDNHWLDCTAGCAVAAAILGATLPEAGFAPKPFNGKRSSCQSCRKRGNRNGSVTNQGIVCPNVAEKCAYFIRAPALI